MYEEIKEQMCDVCHKMWQLGWVAANDGNVSVKLDDNTLKSLQRRAKQNNSKSYTTDKFISYENWNKKNNI